MTDAGAGAETGALESCLADELDVDVVDAEVVHDGVNLSIVVSTAADGPAYVVQRPNQLRDLETFNDLRVEYGVLERLQDTPVPAPEPVLVSDDEAVLGDSFIAMSHLDGEAVPLGSDLPERFQTPAARAALANALVDTMADLHTLDVASVAEVCDRRPVDAHVNRIVGQFEDAIEATGHEPPRFRRVADWLQANVPAETRTALVHGDYRPGNVLFAGADQPRVTGVLDWETAFLGDPLTELGYLLLRWRDAGDPTPSLDPIADRYGEGDAIDALRDRNERGLAPFTSEPGSPTRRALVARYEDATGIAVEDHRFYRAFAAVTLAAVWAMLAHERGGAADDWGWRAHVDYMLATADLVVEEEPGS